MQYQVMQKIMHKNKSMLYNNFTDAEKARYMNSIATNRSDIVQNDIVNNDILFAIAT
jgi:hypothetical protein